MKNILMNSLSDKLKNEKEVAVFLSGGVDSTALLFSLLEMSKKPVAYTFTFEDYESRDFKDARRTCEIFNVPFVPVYLPTSINTLKSDILLLINGYGLRMKAEIECTWPFLYAMKKVNQSVILAGHAADGHFGLSKKAMIHYRHSKEKMNEFRSKYFSKKNVAQNETLSLIADQEGKQIIFPYLEKEMIQFFKDKSWEEINKPKEKMPIREMFVDDFSRINLRKHTNLQLGDSKIAEHFTRLLDTDWNTRNLKSVIGIYNDISKGAIQQ